MSKKKASSHAVTVILPMYNEVDQAERCIREIKAALECFSGSFQILIAEDGSTDGTDRIARRLAAEDHRITHLHSDRRLGKGAALKRAIKNASGEVVVFIDADVHVSSEDLEALIKITKKNRGMSIGSRLIGGAVVRRPAIRRVVCRCYNVLARVLFRDGVHDHQCGFKAFSRGMLVYILDEVRDDGWFFDTEIIVRAKKAGYEVKEIPIKWIETEDRKPKVKIFRDGVQMALALLRLRWRMKKA